jgi:hypothetical protein
MHWKCKSACADARAKVEGRSSANSRGRRSAADWRVGSGGAAPFRYIRSAILKMSQPRKASPNSQKSDTAITVPHPRFLQGVYDFTGRNASNNFTKLIACAPFMTSAYD